jgi:tryptophan halogenase
MEPIAVTPANAFKLSLEAGELVIEFGNVAPPGATPGVAAVEVSDRLILPIDTGRRLLYWLDDALQSHEAALRADEAKELPPAQAAAAARPGQVPLRPQPDEAGERAAQLLRMVGNLGIPHQYERSFQIRERALLANRFLLTVDARDIPGDPVERILQICDGLQMPGAARETAAANFAMAKCIHFGFEADERSIIGKLYLEREVPADEAARARARSEPVLLYLAVKWDLMQTTVVTSRYWWHPGLSAAEIEERLALVYRDGPQTSLDIARAALDLTRDKVAAETLQYLEVDEAENARRSFDLNLYNANLQVKDLQPLLHRMREHFGVRPGQLQALYDQVKAKALGHLAGGVHRNGEDFFNVYYGVVGLPHFHGEFR